MAARSAPQRDDAGSRGAECCDMSHADLSCATPPAGARTTDVYMPSPTLFSKHVLRCFLLVAVVIACVVLMTAYEVQWESGDLALIVLPSAAALFLLGNFIRCRCQLSLLKLLVIVTGISVGFVLVPQHYAARDCALAVANFRQQGFKVTIRCTPLEESLATLFDQNTDDGYFGHIQEVEMIGPARFTMASLELLEQTKTESLILNWELCDPVALEQLNQLPRLRSLRLQSISHSGAFWKLTGGLPTRLTSLSLEFDGGLSTEDAAVIANSTGIVELNLGFSPTAFGRMSVLDCEAAEALTRSPSIRKLSLHACNLNENHLRIFARMRSLEELEIRWTIWQTVTGIDTFRELRPDVHVSYYDHEGQLVNRWQP